MSKERLLFYAISYGLSFLFFGEVVGLRETNFHFGLGKSFLLPLMSASLAVLTLLLLVWAVEYSFIGRFAVVKILFVDCFGSLILSFLIKNFFTGNPTKVCFYFLQNEEKQLSKLPWDNHKVLTGSIWAIKLDEDKGQYSESLRRK